MSKRMDSWSPAGRAARWAPGGFTLAEMLVVIAIVVALVAVVLGPLRSLRNAGAQSTTLSHLRQHALAYRSYSEDHDGRLMPGYMKKEGFDHYGTTNPQDPGSKMYARLPDGTVLDQFNADGLGDSSSYVWRLAPYLDHAWEFFYEGLPDAALVSRLQNEYNNDIYGPGTVGVTDIGISERPAYGLNSIFLGGDDVHGGAWAVERNPWTPSPAGANDIIAATRMSQVKRPSRQIVFAPVAKADTAAGVYVEPDRGFAELRAPFTELTPAGAALKWINCQWVVGANGQVNKGVGFDAGVGGAGLPICRHVKDRLPIANLDGSSEVVQLSDIARDMSRWSPFEVSRRATDPTQ